LLVSNINTTNTIFSKNLMKIKIT